MKGRIMNRSQLFGGLFVALALVGAAFVWQSDAKAGGRKSDAEVKATATATKPNDKGEQLVTITLDISKGYHIYANPVDHEFLTNGQTKVTVAAKVKPAAVDVKYPVGKKVVDGKESYNTYEGRVVIQASVRRAA